MSACPMSTRPPLRQQRRATTYVAPLPLPDARLSAKARRCNIVPPFGIAASSTVSRPCENPGNRAVGAWARDVHGSFDDRGQAGQR